jgi:hypothetical protein
LFWQHIILKRREGKEERRGEGGRGRGKEEGDGWMEGGRDWRESERRRRKEKTCVEYWAIVCSARCHMYKIMIIGNKYLWSRST